MHRLTARTLTVVSLAGLLAAAVLPAQARSSRSEHRGGKKPVGEIVSFDAATSQLVVELKNGDELAAAVDPDVQVKLDHRGHSLKGKAHKGAGHGNPTKGSVEDLVAGTPVLRIKVEDEVVTKIRIRPLAEEPAEEPAGEAGEDETDDPVGDSNDDAEEDDATDEAEDEAPEADDEADDSDDDDPDDDRGDLEDTLPPLPVPQP